MTKSYYEILEIKKTASFNEIKAAFRNLAKKYHPDVNGGKDDRFKEISAAYEILSDPDRRSLYDKHGRTGPIAIQTKKHKYTIERLYASGDIADIYKARCDDLGIDVAIKISRHPKHNDLLNNEVAMFKMVRPADVNDENNYRLFPRLIESTKISDGSHRQTNIFSWLAGYHSFEEIRSAFQEKLPVEHGMWMLRRVLLALSHSHSRNVIHGSLTPKHILAYSTAPGGTGFDHGVALVGWSYAVPAGKPISAISEPYENFYPPEVFAKRPATPGTDIFMAVNCIIHVLGGNVDTESLPSHVPHFFAAFLRSCALKSQDYRPQDATELARDLTKHVRKHYGPKKYVPFTVPATN